MNHVEEDKLLNLKGMCTFTARVVVVVVIQLWTSLKEEDGLEVEKMFSCYLNFNNYITGM